MLSHISHPLVAVDALFHIFPRTMLFFHVPRTVSFAFQVFAAFVVSALDHYIFMGELHVRPQTPVVEVHPVAVNTLFLIVILPNVHFFDMQQEVCFVFHVLLAIAVSASDNVILMAGQ
jgi:hypothetical protein